MSCSRAFSLAIVAILASACAEGASGPGGLGSGGAGQGGATAGPGGSGPGSGGSGGSGQGSDATSGPSGGGAPSSSSTEGTGGDAASTSTSSSTAETTTSVSTTQASTGSGIEPGTVFFSEYVESSTGNDKALEIYNAGSTSIDLDDCHLEFHQNGAPSPSFEVPLEDQMLASEATYVICQANFSSPGKCDRTDAMVQHNGDDAIALVCGGQTKDVFGRIGDDPGSAWGSGDTASEDNVLRRKCTVTEGDSNGSDAFDPEDEWDGFAEDDFSDLGERNCP